MGSLGTAIPVAVIAALALGLSSANLGDWAVLTPDSLTYLGTARHWSETGQWPSRRLMHPPGFPLAVAPLLGPDDPLPFRPIRVLNSMAFACSCVLTFVLARRRLGPNWGFAAACLTATSPLLIHQTATVLSESLFMPLSLVSLCIVDRWASGRAPGPAGIIAAAAMAAAASLVRSMGIVLGPIAALALVSQRGAPARTRFARSGLFCLAFATPIMIWMAHQATYPPSHGYAEIWTNPRPSEQTDSRGLRLQMQRLATFSPMRMEDISRAVLPQTVLWRIFQPPWQGAAAWLIGGGLLLVAILLSIRQGRWMDRYVLATLLMLCLWPWDEKERLVAPLVPILLIYAVEVARRWHEPARSRPLVSGCAYVAVAAMIAAYVSEFALQQPRMEAHRQRCERETSTMREMAAHLKSNLPPSAPLTCIMSRQGEARILAAGAAYLARRPIDRFLDVSNAAEVKITGTENLLVHRTLAEAPTLRGYGAPKPVGGEFVLLLSPSPPRHPAGAPAGTGPGTGS